MSKWNSLLLALAATLTVIASAATAPAATLTVRPTTRMHPGRDFASVTVAALTPSECGRSLRRTTAVAHGSAWRAITLRGIGEGKNVLLITTRNRSGRVLGEQKETVFVRRNHATARVALEDTSCVRFERGQLDSCSRRMSSCRRTRGYDACRREADSCRERAQANRESCYSRSGASSTRYPVLEVHTGDDDLRGGNDNVTATVKLKDGSTKTFRNINRGKRWADRCRSHVLLSLSRPELPERLSAISLTTSFGGGIGGDNWNVAGLRLLDPTGGVLFQRRGQPYIVRLTGSHRGFQWLLR